MKKANVLLAVSAVFFICGCNKQPDSAKIDWLIQNQVLMCSNQVAICQRLDAVKAQVDALPSTKQLDTMSFYYHTNTLNSLYIESDKLAKQNALLLEATGGPLELCARILTNLARVEGNQLDAQSSLWKIQTDTSGAFFLLTNSILFDVGYTKLKIDDVGQDARAIKARLGIF